VVKSNCALEEIMNKVRSLFFLFAAVSILSLAVVAQDAAPRMIAGGILNGKAISLPIPPYPDEAKSAGISGTVYVFVVLDESGSVVSAVASTDRHAVTRSKDQQPVEVEIPVAHPILREAAEKAALEARFSPTLLSGQPVKVSGTIVYNFVGEDLAAADPDKEIESPILNGIATSLPAPLDPAAARAV
jgi:hypothetical protein